MSFKVKVSIIGDFGVGKSSLLNVLNNNKEYCCQSTLGVDFFYKNFTYENKSFLFHIWDTAGQERFRAIVKSYFRNLDVAILVFDVTDLYSLDNLERWDTDLDTLNNNPNLIKILVGNKIDSKERYIKKNNALDMAKKYGYTYFETSCKDKTTIDKLFEGILEIIYEKNIRSEIQLKQNINYKDLEVEKFNEMTKKKRNKYFCCQIL